MTVCEGETGPKKQRSSIYLSYLNDSITFDHYIIITHS